jgi:hypothetical protein
LFPPAGADLRREASDAAICAGTCPRRLESGQTNFGTFTFETNFGTFTFDGRVTRQACLVAPLVSPRIPRARTGGAAGAAVVGAPVAVVPFESDPLVALATP